MRAGVFLCFALTLATSAAIAAPTCLDQTGAPIRCGTPGAMPVGWKPTDDDPAFERPAEAPMTTGELAALIYVVGGIFALIALMPPFDGRNPEDWDRQEGDDPR